MALYTKFNSFVSALAQKKMNLNSDTLKIMLTNVAPNAASNTIKTDITEIAAGNGYTAGGSVATFVSGNNTAGSYKLILSPVVFTAAGGSFAAFEFAVLYDSSATNQDLVSFWDYGVALTLTNGNSFTVALDQTNGVFTLV